MIAFLSIAVIGLYMWQGRRTSRRERLRNWPLHRYVLWMLGVASVVLAIELQGAGHTTFTVHMVVHLLLGMLAPLLFVVSAPITLLLRSLSIQNARIVTKALRLGFIRFISHPAVAAFINIGSLWLVYRTSLFELMHVSPLISALVHLHMFMAGFVFTAAVLYIDPVPHRVNFEVRAIIIVLAFAMHGVLAKIVYVQSLPGVDADDARQGALFMYYGGDLVDACLILLFCWFWFRKSSLYQKNQETIFS